MVDKFKVGDNNNMTIFVQAGGKSIKYYAFINNITYYYDLHCFELCHFFHQILTV